MILFGLALAGAILSDTPQRKGKQRIWFHVYSDNVDSYDGHQAPVVRIFDDLISLRIWDSKDRVFLFFVPGLVDVVGYDIASRPLPMTRGLRISVMLAVDIDSDAPYHEWDKKLQQGPPVDERVKKIFGDEDIPFEHFFHPAEPAPLWPSQGPRLPLHPGLTRATITRLAQQGLDTLWQLAEFNSEQDFQKRAKLGRKTKAQIRNLLHGHGANFGFQIHPFGMQGTQVHGEEALYIPGKFYEQLEDEWGLMALLGEKSFDGNFRHYQELMMRREQMERLGFPF